MSTECDNIHVDKSLAISSATEKGLLPFEYSRENVVFTEVSDTQLFFEHCASGQPLSLVSP